MNTIWQGAFGVVSVPCLSRGFIAARIASTRDLELGDRPLAMTFCELGYLPEFPQ
jgi:hypothetical protein